MANYLVAILLFLALALPASSAHAGGVVTVCDEAHLRAALAGGGTVTFSCSGTITLAATLTIAANTTIDGSGHHIILSGGNAVRVLRVNSGVTLNLNKLTIANGKAPDSGGGIYNAGTLIVSNSTITHNQAFPTDLVASGGGIYNAGGAVTLNSSAVVGNFASYTTGISFGGGISNANGTLTVRSSKFLSNSAFAGGGINAYGTNSVVTVSNSTFAGNRARRIGGGIYDGGSSTAGNSTLTVSKSTFVDNDADYSGGGIFTGGHSTVTVANSTFVDNDADSCGGGAIYNTSYNTSHAFTISNSTFSGNRASSACGSGGGAIFNYYNSRLTLKNTIVANNPEGGNCVDPSHGITDGGGNLSYPYASCPGINGNPLLGPLQYNGGPTQTMALGPGSAARDAGEDANCEATDQRGIPRPQGPRCDIGAYEVRIFVYLPMMKKQ